LAAEELEEAAGAWAAVGAQEAHAIEEDEELEDFGVFGAALGILRGGLLGFIEEGGKGVVEAALDGRDRTMFIDNAGGQRFVGLGQRFERGKGVGVGGGGFCGAEFGNGEGDGGEKLRMDTDEIRGQANVEQRRVGGELARVSFFVAMRGDEVSAVGRAVEGDFAFGAAADGADGFGFGGAEAAGFAFLTDRTGQKYPLERRVNRAKSARRGGRALQVRVLGRTEYHAMMTLFWKRRAAITRSMVPMKKRATASIQRCAQPAPRRMMPRVMSMK